MSPGAKVFLGLAGAGALIGVVILAGSKNAHAAPGGKPKPQIPGDNTPPDVIVPPVVQQPSTTPPALPTLPTLPTVPPLVPPAAQTPSTPATPLPPLPTLPQAPIPSPLPSVPAGVTFSLPNPLGGPPLGTVDPATGNVFGPNGVIIGTFDPVTGVFTTSGGQRIQIPGMGSQPAAQQPSPPLPVPVVPPAPSLPSTPAPAPAPAPAPVVTAPVSTVKADTAAMVAALLDAETRAGWNTTDPNVQVFQKARGLTADAKFGPGTALAAAAEIGTLPLVRFWPLGSTKAKLLENYKAALLELANKSADPNHAQQLRLSAAREDARAFSTKGKLPALPLDMQVALAKVA